METKLTDELVYLRELARQNKNFKESDLIRNILDERGSFVFDTANGQVVYHLGKGYTRESVQKNIEYINMCFNK